MENKIIKKKTPTYSSVNSTDANIKVYKQAQVRSDDENISPNILNSKNVTLRKKNKGREVKLDTYSDQNYPNITPR